MASLSMPKTQREQLMVVLGVVGLLAAGAYWNFVYKPESVRLATVDSATMKLDQANQRAKVQLASGTVAELREQAAAYRENLELMRKLVPAGNEVPSLVDQISNSARRVGLDLGQIEPLGPEIGTDFDAYKYKLRVAGSYHALAEFLANVGSLTRVVVPVNLMLTAAQPGGGPNRTATTTFELHTYVAHTAVAK